MNIAALKPRRIRPKKRRKRKQMELLPHPKRQPLSVLHPSVHPSMVVVGNRLRVNEVSKELTDLGIEVKKAKYIKDVRDLLDGSELGIIYVAPLVRSEIISVHKNLRKKPQFSHIPFFAVVPTWVSNRKERHMYKEGIRMIFEWPKEKQTFTRLLSTALTSGLEKVRSEDTDKSLVKAIENRMAGEYGMFSPDFKTYVYNGIVILRGKVNSVAKKLRLVDKIKKVPGVRGVVDASLEIETKVMNPKQVKKTANNVLEKTNGIHEKTLEVMVRPKDQKLILTGTASGKNKVEQAKQRLEDLHGVKKVENRVIISPKIHKKDMSLAKRAQRVVKKLNLGSRNSVKVKVTAGVALLKGSVRNTIEARQLSRAVKSLDGISRVENKMEYPLPANY